MTRCHRRCFTENGPSFFFLDAKSYFLAFILFFSIKKKDFALKKDSALKKRFCAGKKDSALKKDCYMIIMYVSTSCTGGLQGVLLHQANPSEAMPVFCAVRYSATLARAHVHNFIQ